jgi:hypothetical protein
MRDATKAFRDLLAADARRRAKAAVSPEAPAPVVGEQAASLDLGLRLVNVFPRQSKPVFSALRETLAPFGYTLTPLHPVHDLGRPAMRTELARLAADDPAQYVPLIFELDPQTESARVFVRLADGRQAPTFPQRRFDLAAAPDLASPDLAALEAILRDYVRCVLEAQPLAPA